MTHFYTGQRVRVTKSGSIFRGREGSVLMVLNKFGGVVVELDGLNGSPSVAMHSHSDDFEAVSQPLPGESPLTRRDVLELLRDLLAPTGTTVGSDWEGRGGETLVDHAALMGAITRAIDAERSTATK